MEHTHLDDCVYGNNGQVEICIEAKHMSSVSDITAVGSKLRAQY